MADKKTKSAVPGRASAKKPTGKPIIGWRELAAFPDLGIDRIHAKIDTGAKSSAVHAFQVSEITIDGEEFIDFYLHPRRRKKNPEVFCRAPLIDKRIIRSSNGQEEERYVIQTRLRMGEKAWKIDLTLTNRDTMDFRLLIGRDALAKKFIIDPSASYLLGDTTSSK